MQRQIGELVKVKGFGNTSADFEHKLFFAFLELGEAGDLWKKGPEKALNKGQPFASKEEWEDALVEELIDVMFYVIDGARVLMPGKNLDEAFEKKLTKNWGRPHRYGEDEANVIHHNYEGGQMGKFGDKIG